MNTRVCQFCGSNITETYDFQSCRRFICKKCGIYQLKNGNFDLQLSKKEKIIFKHYFLMPKEDARRLDIIELNNKKEILSRVRYPKNLTEKIDKIISYFGNRTEYVEQLIILSWEELYRLFFIWDKDEYFSIFDYIENKKKYLNALNTTDNRIGFKLTIEGIEYYESQLAHKKILDQCFVAMWFNDEINPYYESVQLAVAGTDTKNRDSLDYGANYQIIKIDNKEHINYIPDEIMSEIKRSRFIIADLTGSRGGVYYEAGYADGLGLPVILTCRTNDLETVHFDLKQKNILLWTNDESDKDYDKYNLNEFRKALTARIGAVVGFNE